jgi:hypothetical protein
VSGEVNLDAHERTSAWVLQLARSLAYEKTELPRAGVWSRWWRFCRLVGGLGAIFVDFRGWICQGEEGVAMVVEIEKEVGRCLVIFAFVGRALVVEGCERVVGGRWFVLEGVRGVVMGRDRSLDWHFCIGAVEFHLFV